MDAGWNGFWEGSQDGQDRSTSLESVEVGGQLIRSGDRVRLEPKRRADAFDLLLAGRTAIIEAIEQDFEDQIYLAVTIEDDPGQDIGLLRQTGHRFFYTLEEVVPLDHGHPGEAAP